MIKIHLQRQTRSAAHIEYGSALTQEKSVHNYITSHTFLALRSRVNCENISHTKHIPKIFYLKARAIS